MDSMSLLQKMMIRPMMKMYLLDLSSSRISPQNDNNHFFIESTVKAPEVAVERF